MYLSDPSHSDPFLVLHSSILQPSSSLVALLAELLKLEPATTTPIYIYIDIRISRGGGGVGARVHIPGGRRAENNKVRLSSGTPLPPLHLPPPLFHPSFTRSFHPLPRTFHFGLRTAGASLSIQFRSHLCTPGPASVHTCRRTYVIFILFYCKPIPSPGLS